VAERQANDAEVKRQLYQEAMERHMQDKLDPLQVCVIM
jgi:hypothetical protein